MQFVLLEEWTRKTSLALTVIFSRTFILKTGVVLSLCPAASRLSEPAGWVGWLRSPPPMSRATAVLLWRLWGVTWSKGEPASPGNTSGILVTSRHWGWAHRISTVSYENRCEIYILSVNHFQVDTLFFCFMDEYESNSLLYIETEHMLKTEQLRHRSELVCLSGQMHKLQCQADRIRVPTPPCIALWLSAGYLSTLSYSFSICKLGSQ